MSSNEQRRQEAKHKLQNQLVRHTAQVKRRRTIMIGVAVAVAMTLVASVFSFTTTDSGKQPPLWRSPKGGSSEAAQPED